MTQGRRRRDEVTLSLTGQEFFIVNGRDGNDSLTFTLDFQGTPSDSNWVKVTSFDESGKQGVTKETYFTDVRPSLLLRTDKWFHDFGVVVV
ncbi:hypothetical protein G7K_5979-t1 [Saitoella complicata NRRL Y-17804]|uniref:Uncharacterized protein n=1 Tax=Saitoella complicata (strain BCRC 22490 / CBS 7301 / JCM 7358 / NBRC 10748 / NRRL Y-17804) TaxID=698492 RepID=A0A0E9NPY4_SAICN|nr:hypothetical protein G7K_5979-t1 [Saitoella complicata NRRL Y-17804]